MAGRPPPRDELSQLHQLGDSKFGKQSRGGAVSAPSAARGSYAAAPRPAVSAAASGGTISIVSAAAAGAFRPGASAAPPPPIERTAAMGHRANDRYMEDWEAAYEELHGGAAGGGSGGGGAMQGRLTGRPAAASSSSAAAASITMLDAGGSSGSGIRRPAARGPAAAPSSSEPAAAAPASTPPTLTPQWWRGPLDAAGRLTDLSDRPTMCMAVDGARMEAVCGSSDHAVYGVDLRRGGGGAGGPPGKPARTLFGGRWGHSEWVTAVCYLGDGSGRVASAGMDGKVCVWGAKAVGRQWQCADLAGHFGSVSAVAAPGGGTAACGPAAAPFSHLLVSAGYDKTVRLWDAPRGSCLMSAKAHGAPVLNLALSASPRELWGVTGDRDGVGRVWRLHDGVEEGALKGHKGHMTAVAWLRGDAGRDGGEEGAPSSAGSTGGGDLVVTGAQDGHVRVWDVRSHECVANVGAHATTGSGAVGDICIARVGPLPSHGEGGGGSGGGGDGGSETVIVTSGADRRVCVLDPRAGFTVRHTFTEHRDFIYSLATAGSLSFSGGGDGTLIAHDLSAGRPLWGLGAGTAAIRCIGTAGRHLVASGDDGKALVLDF
jgi:WD40 repeat protein